MNMGLESFFYSMAQSSNTTSDVHFSLFFPTKKNTLPQSQLMFLQQSEKWFENQDQRIENLAICRKKEYDKGDKGKRFSV